MAAANVTDVTVLDELKDTLIAFNEGVRMGLSATDSEVRRCIEWLRHEQPTIWKRVVDKGRDEIAAGKAALARKRLQRTDNYIPDTTEEEKAIRRAVAKVENAERQIEKCGQWRRTLEKAYDEYVGLAGQIGELVEGNPSRAVSFIQKAIRSLENYLAVRHEGAAAGGPAGGGGAGAMTRPADDGPTPATTGPADDAVAATPVNGERGAGDGP